MAINYILIIIFVISAPASGISWYLLQKEYFERNNLSDLHFFTFGKRDHKETLKGNPFLVKIYTISTITALASIMMLFIGNVVKANW